MSLRRLFLSIVVLFTGIGIQAQSFSRTSGKPIVIPFTLTKFNNIVVTAVINNIDTVRLMFHTAFSGVAITSEAVKKMKSLRFEEKTDTIQSWGGSNTARHSNNNTLAIGGIQSTSLSVWEDLNSGQESDGKFGPDILEQYMIGVDFDKGALLLYDDLPKKIRRYKKIKIEDDDLLFIKAKCRVGDSVFQHRFLLHSGFAGALLFDDAFANEKKLSALLPVTGEKTLSDSYGHTIKTKTALLPQLLIGKWTIKNVPVGFFEGSIAQQSISVMGGDILKRFNFIIDRERKFIYLKRNRLFGTAHNKY